MRRLIAVEYVSLDGVVQAPGYPDEDRDGGFSHGGWTAPWMADHRRLNEVLFQSAGAFLLGRRTYDLWAAYWPTVRDPSDEIARVLNTVPKYVASRTLQRSAWADTTVIRDVPADVLELKRRPGQPIFVAGSHGLVADLLTYDLIDEYQLWIHPVVLGQGKRLFVERSRKMNLTLRGTYTTASGLVILTLDASAPAERGQAS